MESFKYSSLNIEYLLNLLIKEGLLGQSKALEFKNLYEQRQEGNKRVTKEVSDWAAKISNPIDFIVNLKILYPLGYKGQTVGDEIIAKLIADDNNLSYRKLDIQELDIELVTKILPQNFALKNLLLPIGEYGGKMEFAVAHPFKPAIFRDVSKAVGMPISLIIAPQNNLRKLVNEIYTFRASIVGAEGQFTEKAAGSLDLANLEQYVKLKSTQEISDDDEHIRNVVNFLFNEAFEKRASDIHLEPKRDKFLVRMRVDGILHDMYPLPKSIQQAIVSRIKTLSRLDIAERRRPQDGRIKISKQNTEAEVRVSTVPVAFGEKMVMRILDPEALFMNLDDLFFKKADYEKWQSFIAKPHGIILVTGPTGSGKTTTLYSTLRRVATPEVNVTTIEDPIEMIHEEFNQIAVQPKIGISFGNIIRNILRQDPDIIMVGEMRDAETAENAVQAALTGHLVFSTLHTNDAPGAITRMIELGVPSYLISSTMLGIMAQRLLRKVCKYCQEDYLLHKEEALVKGFIIAEDLILKRGNGCDMCRNTGYLGRVAAVEVMPFSLKINQATLASKNALELKDVARLEGMRTLRENAFDMVLAGLTTIDEIMRVTIED